MEWLRSTATFLPEKLQDIDGSAFAGDACLESVTIKNPDVEIEREAFENDNILTLHCYKDSTALTYAKENSIKYDTSLGERPAKLNGLSKSTDGNWYYYKENEVDESYTGLAQYGGSWWYVKNGVLNTSTTLCRYGNNWYAVSGGKVAWSRQACRMHSLRRRSQL